MSYIPGPQNSLNLGGSSAFPGLVMPKGLITPIILVGGTDAVAASVTYIFQKAGGTTQGAYQITAGKTYRVIGAWSRGTNHWGLGQSSGAPTQGGGAPTGPVYYNAAGALSAAGGYSSGIGASADGTTRNWIDLQGVTFTAAYYPFFYSVGGGVAQSVILVGYEE